jgi:Flavin-binding monooxygenase-like
MLHVFASLMNMCMSVFRHYWLLLFATTTITLQNVNFADGSTAGVDTVILCTGYDYSFPFLESACSSSSCSSSCTSSDTKLDLSWADKHVQPLYQQIFHTQRTDLSFIGLPHSVVPFPLFELQAKLVAAVYTGAVQLPDLAGTVVCTQNYVHSYVHTVMRLLSLSHCFE